MPVFDADAAGSAAYREQTIEIALGSNGASENGNISTLTRQVPTRQVVSTVTPPWGKLRKGGGAPNVPTQIS